MARKVIYDIAENLTVLGNDCVPNDPDAGVACLYLGQAAYALTDTSAATGLVTVILRGIVRIDQSDIDGDVAVGNNVVINGSTGQLEGSAPADAASMAEPFYGVIFAVDGALTADIRLGGLPAVDAGVSPFNL